MRPTPARLAAVSVAAFACGPAPAQDRGEFSAHGHGVVRVEAEAKLAVPQAETEEVWTWLSERYRDPSFLDRDGHLFTATFGDEHFTDRYFDSPDLAFLATQSGVRHRARTVMEGSAAAKDGRQLVQLKLNRSDAEGIERSEIKYEVDPAPGIDPATEKQLLALLDKDDRIPLAEQILANGADPRTLRPILTVDQNRRRVYLADQHGPFATITLDMVTCSGWWQEAKWTEVELELNEIRYTEADASARAAMSSLLAAVQADLVARFPAIRQDQTPKYNKGFVQLEAGMPLALPLRQLIAWRAAPDDVVAIAVVALGGVLVAGYLAVRRRRRGGAAIAASGASLVRGAPAVASSGERAVTGP